jgi:signal transduction histidine kinase
VYNDGLNIPSEDLPRLWEPFYRADPSRSRDSGGTGLGLAIVRNTVEAHGGRCWAENRPVGVVFLIELPL